MSIEYMYSKYGMFFATFHHILFWKVRSWSVRTGPKNFGGPVRKDLNLLGPLVHYLSVFRFTKYIHCKPIPVMKIGFSQ